MYCTTVLPRNAPPGCDAAAYSSKPSGAAAGAKSGGAQKLDGSYAPLTLGAGGSGGGRSFTPDPSLRPSQSTGADFKSSGVYASLMRSTPTPPRADR